MENRKRVIRLINVRTEDVLIQEIRVRQLTQTHELGLADSWGYGTNMNVDEWIISDWIGKLDKSNKQIFEHDIIEFDGRLWEIRWDPQDCCFVIYNRLTGDNQLLDFDTQELFEVKGNIHLFPELLAILEGKEDESEDKKES